MSMNQCRSFTPPYHSILLFTSAALTACILFMNSNPSEFTSIRGRRLTVADEQPPIISLRLAGMSVPESYQITKYDKDGHPCNSMIADKASCDEVADDSQNTYYAFCRVLHDDSVSCPEPVAEANDHHEGALSVQTTVKLIVRSQPRSSPELVDTVEPAIDYNVRGEWALKFDAKDSSGNEANTVWFHFFLVDYDAPLISGLAEDENNDGSSTSGQYDISSRFFNFPSPVVDDEYDGDCSDHVSLRIVNPAGQISKYNDMSKAIIDTSVQGKYDFELMVSDYAEVFGRDYHDNGAQKSGYLLVKPSIVEAHLGANTSYFVALPPSPAPSAPEPDHTLIKPHVDLPPILMLTNANGDLITRGSPYGKAKTKEAYSASLSAKGYDQEEVQMHLDAIIEQEMVLAQTIGDENIWQGLSEAVVTARTTGNIHHP